MRLPQTSGLSSLTRLTITTAARTTYPHDALPGEVYARVADKLAEIVREGLARSQTFESGASALNGTGPFSELSANAQFEFETVKRIEGCESFELVGSTAVDVYSEPQTWQLCGYEATPSVTR